MCIHFLLENNSSVLNMFTFSNDETVAFDIPELELFSFEDSGDIF